MINIYGGRTSFWQWDSDQKVTSSNFKVGDKIHFFNMKNSTALVTLAYELDGVVVADVPNILLQKPLPLMVYHYIDTEDSHFTNIKKTFEVNQRPKPDDYICTQTEVLNITTAVEKAVQQATASGKFNGKDGKDGLTPQKGVDYWTEDDKAELVEEISTTVTGDIETALDSIIALQNSLIGGDEE